MKAIVLFLLLSVPMIAQVPPFTTTPEPRSSIDMLIDARVAALGLRAPATIVTTNTVVETTPQPLPDVLMPFAGILGPYASKINFVVQWLALVNFVGVFTRDRSKKFFAGIMTDVAANQKEDDDVWLRSKLSIPWYRYFVAPLAVAILPVSVPTLAEFERIVKLEAQAVIDAAIATQPPK